MLQQEKPSGDVIQLRGAIEAVLKNAENGQVVQHYRGENVVLTVGRHWILDKLTSDSNANLIDRIYLGTSLTEATNTQTGLQASAASQTFNVGITNNASSSVPHVIFCASWASGETFTNSTKINEIGLYASSGTGVGRYVTSSTINFDSTNTLCVSYTLSN